MELYKVEVKMTLVLATPDYCEPAAREVGNALKNELDQNGITSPDEVKISQITKESQIPKGWAGVIPWSIHGSVNRGQKNVLELISKLKCPYCRGRGKL